MVFVSEKWQLLILFCFIGALAVGLFFKLIKKESLITWILSTTILVLSINIIFLHQNIVIESLLDYKDSLLMLLSLIPTVAIAFFQYKIQKISDKEKEEYENYLRNREKYEKEIAQRWHKEELCSERIQNISSSFFLKGYAVNLNIKQSEARYSSLRSGGKEDSVFYVELKPEYAQKTKIFPEYFNIDYKKITLANKDVLSSEILSEITNDGFRFWITKSAIDAELKKFIIDEYTNSEKKLIPCEILVDLEDQSLMKDYLKMQLSIKFNIVATSAYDMYGSFEISIHNVNISLAQLYDLEENNI